MRLAAGEQAEGLGNHARTRSVATGSPATLDLAARQGGGPGSMLPSPPPSSLNAANATRSTE